MGGSVDYRFTNKVTDSGWLTSDLIWNEVGSLWLQADGEYQVGDRSLKLDQGTVEIGRFYPHHFVLKQSALTDTVNNTFTYMDQGFEASFTVEAQSKSNGPTKNYGLFHSDLNEQAGVGRYR